MMEDNKQLALRIDGAVQSANQEVTNLRAELTATNRRLAELSGGGGPGPGPAAAAGVSAAADSAAGNMENHQHGAQGRDRSAPRAEQGGRHRLALWRVTPVHPEVATAAPLLSGTKAPALWARVRAGGESEAEPAAPSGSRKCPLEGPQPPAPWANFSCPGLCPRPRRERMPPLPPVPDGRPLPLEWLLPAERAPGSAAGFGVEAGAAPHFSPRMPNPSSPLHLDFICSPSETAQAVEHIQATVDALLSREFKFPANNKTPRGLSRGATSQAE